jgi:chromosome partitioning protein
MSSSPGRLRWTKSSRKPSVRGLFRDPANIDLSGAAVELVEQQDRDYYLKRPWNRRGPASITS